MELAGENKLLLFQSKFIFKCFYLNPFRLSVAFYTETSNLFCRAKTNEWLVSIWNATLGWEGLNTIFIVCFCCWPMLLIITVLLKVLNSSMVSSDRVILKTKSKEQKRMKDGNRIRQ